MAQKGSYGGNGFRRGSCDGGGEETEVKNPRMETKRDQNSFKPTQIAL